MNIYQRNFLKSTPARPMAGYDRSAPPMGLLIQPIVSSPTRPTVVAKLIITKNLTEYSIDALFDKLVPIKNHASNFASCSDHFGSIYAIVSTRIRCPDMQRQSKYNTGTRDFCIYNSKKPIMNCHMTFYNNLADCN